MAIPCRVEDRRRRQKRPMPQWHSAGCTFNHAVRLSADFLCCLDRPPLVASPIHLGDVERAMTKDGFHMLFSEFAPKPFSHGVTDLVRKPSI
jgi:hypothetical protein